MSRCFGDGDPLYERYHDTEWGFPASDERALFERPRDGVGIGEVLEAVRKIDLPDAHGHRRVLGRARERDGQKFSVRFSHGHVGAWTRTGHRTRVRGHHADESEFFERK